MMARERGPYGEVLSLRDAMNRLAEDSFVRSRGMPHSDTAVDVPIDLYDSGDAYVLRAVLPGARPEDVQVTMLADTVHLKGSIHMHQADPQRNVSWLVHEVPHGHFSRVISLPQRADPDAASATFDAGILTLRLPKVAEHRPRQIKITPR